jgi:hypothetical protein
MSAHFLKCCSQFSSKLIYNIPIIFEILFSVNFFFFLWRKPEIVHIYLYFGSFTVKSRFLEDCLELQQLGSFNESLMVSGAGLIFISSVVDPDPH